VKPAIERKILAAATLLVACCALSACNTYQTRRVEYHDDYSYREPRYDRRHDVEIDRTPPPAYQYSDRTPVEPETAAALYHQVELSGPGVRKSENDTSSPRLVPGKHASLAYSITTSPLNQGNRASAGISSDLQNRIALNETTNLLAYFDCGVCQPEDRQQPPERIQVGADGTLRSVTFSFTPTADHGPASPLAPEGLRIDLFDASGVHYDRVELCVEAAGRACNGPKKLVMTEGRDIAGEGAAPVTLHVETEEIRQPPRLEADIVLTLSAPAAEEGRVPLQMQISSPRLISEIIGRLEDKGHFAVAKRMREKAEETDGKELWLNGETVFPSLPALNAEMRAAYYRLTCMVSADDGLTSALKQERPVSCAQDLDRSMARLSGQGAPFDWSSEPRARAKANRHLEELGDRLFATVFSNRDLAAVMTAVAEAGREIAERQPVTVRVVSKSEHIPFQLFHVPGGGHDAFFGLTFDIFDAITVPATAPAHAPRHEGLISIGADIDPVVGLYTENVEVTAQTDCAATFTSELFLDKAINHYPQGAHKPGTAEAKAADVARIARLACESYQDLVEGIGDRVKAPAVTAGDFIGSGDMGGLGAQAKTTKLIWFYGHGLSRDTADASTDADRLTQAETSLNAKLIFAAFDKDASSAQLTAARLSDLARSRKHVFTQAPLVVLLACELGATKGNAIGVAMTDAFVALGARGVVSAEAELDAQTARVFGQYLIRELKGLTPDKGPSRAVLASRRKIHAQYGGNLWPLLIYYAGSPGPYLAR
jgi:hypothetical protein